MRKPATVLLIMAMMVISSCQKCVNTTPRSLKQVTFQKSDGSVYSFTVQSDNNGISTLTDDVHKLQIKIIKGTVQTMGEGYAKGFFVGYGVDTYSVVQLNLKDQNFSTPEQTINTMQSLSADTTKAFNLGNKTYNISSWPVYSMDSAKPLDVYVMSNNGANYVLAESLHTLVPGVYDTSLKCVYNYNTGTPRSHNGDHYYLYPDGMYMWITECAIGFSNSSFNDIATYIQRQHERSLELDGLTYYQNGNITAQYNYTFIQDSNHWVITKKTITDNNGKVSTVTYVYNGM